MATINLNKLPVFCGTQLTIFKTLSFVYTYSALIASSKNFLCATNIIGKK